MPDPSKEFWDSAARENAAWHIATKYRTESDDFFESGAAEVDEFLEFAGASLNKSDRLLEIGCGVGRMTRRLAELAGTVIASDVSGEMLSRARENLSARSNITFLELSGPGELPLADEAVTAVFSYITMQHVPTATAQERYFAESLRVLAPGGWMLIQYRKSGIRPRILDWMGHLAHLAKGRRTLSRAWRGSRIREEVLRGFVTENVSIEILPHGGRHMWAFARKGPGLRQS